MNDLGQQTSGSYSQEVEIETLHPHPRLLEIYGEEDEADLVRAVELTAQRGWIEPLTVTQNLAIISGYRYYKAARKLGWSCVPVVVRSFKAPLDELEALL